MKYKYDIIIKNSYIYDIEKNCILKKDIAINDGIIRKISNKIKDDAHYIYNLKNHIILPGFINSHIHFGEFYIKGYKDKKSTLEYINYAEHINSNNKSISEEMRVTSSIISAYEALSYGQTTLVGIRGWKCLEKFGIRLYMGYPFMNSQKLRGYLDDAINRFKKLKKNDTCDYYIFIHSLLTIDEKILANISNYFKNTNVKLAIHLYETESEKEMIKKKYNMNGIDLLNKYDLLNENTLLVHCCYLSENDINLIKNKRCSLSINPCSNLKLKNNVPKYELIKDLNICLGTDGCATSDSLNIMESCRLFGLLNEIEDKDLLKMITINPAKYLDNKIGIIKNGYNADLIIYDLNNYKVVRKETFINNLIYSSEIKPKYVFVNGKLIIKNYINKFYSNEDICKKNISIKINYN